MSNTRILLVEDEPFMRKVLKNILTNHGYDVVSEAENGQVGIEKYKDK